MKRVIRLEELLINELRERGEYVYRAERFDKYR
jgi:hypothetical protein